MATHNTTSKSSQNRAEDRLDLTVLLGIHVSSLALHNKASVVYAAQREAARLTKSRLELEKRLVALISASKSLVGFFTHAIAIRKLKTKLTELNQKILDWMSATAKFYALKFANVLPA